MKTVIFISNFMGQGGAARVIATLAEALREREYRVIIASFPFEGFGYSIPEGIKEVKLDVPSGNKGIKRKIQRIKEIRNLLMRYQGATVFAFEYFVGMETVLAAIGSKCRVVVSERNDPNKVKSRLKCFCRNFLFSKADAVVCQTMDAKKCFPKSVQRKTYVIMNPLMSDLPLWNKDNHDKIIINFCRLTDQKNIPMLFEAFKKVHIKHPEYTLLIHGEGDASKFIKSLVTEMKLDNIVTIKPFVGNIHEIAAKCAMFVSSSDYEGLSNSMLEAMAMGMPVVCTDCPIGGARMVIEDGVNGLLTPVGDADALSKSLLDVIEDKALAEKLSRKALRIREQLNVDTIVKQWIKLL